MARTSKTAGGEQAAYEKLTAACRHGIEAATELGVLQSNNSWSHVGLLFEKVLQQVAQHHVSRAVRRGN